MPLDNFSLVSPTERRWLYRSAQPDADGFDTLAAMGFTQIIKLNEVSDGELQMEIKAAKSMLVDYWPLKPFFFDVPLVKQLATRLNIETRTTDDNGPILIHCRFGRDRTGLIVAAYRVMFNGWPLERAMAEWETFGLSGIYKVLDFDLEGMLAVIAEECKAK